MDDTDGADAIPDSSVRRNRLQLLIEKRGNGYSYLKDLHRGSLWLNYIRFPEEDINKYTQQLVSPNRSTHLFYFGLSIAKLIDTRKGSLLVRAITQLLEEWEYYTASFSIQSMKYVMARNTLTAFPQNVSSNDSGESVDRGLLFKFNNDIVYQFLLTPSVSFDMNFIEVMSCVCDILNSMYATLMNDEDCYMNSITFTAILRNDRRIQRQIVEPVVNELTELSRQRISAEMDLIRTGADCRGGRS